MALLLLVVCIVAAFNAATAIPYEAGSPPPNGNWQQVWIDNFDSFDNNPHTNNRWSFDLTNDWNNTTMGWGNGEYQYYTSNPKNIRAENGNLIIEIQVETGNKPHSSNGVAFDLTSARIATRGHESWGVGHRFLARARLPTGRATWPAFWHLPEPRYPGDPGASWPRGGELDTMEHWAQNMGMVASSTHCLGTDGHTKRDTTKQIVVQNGQTFFSDFHVYECQLRADRVDFFMDSKWIYGLVKQGCLDNGIAWPWTDRNFHTLLNVALIEWNFDWNNRKQEIINALKNAPESARQMHVDYVRVDRLA